MTVAARTDLSARQSMYLDAVRGFAALVVVVFHVRYRLFADFSEVPDTVLARAFYGATAFGHEAVMAFFVLSGLLIARSVYRGHGAGRLTWREYASARLTRLYLVLVPGLLFTAALDAAGVHLFPNHPVYTGLAAPWWHDFFDVPARLSVPAFAGNLAFLQTIIVAPFGSNQALWSLSFEFWYYALFPLVWIVASARDTLARVKAAAGALAILWFTGFHIAAYFPLWLAGAALPLLPRARVAPFALRLSALGVAASLAAVLVLTHTIWRPWSMLFRDYLVGGVFAVLTYLFLLDRRPDATGWSAQVVRWLAGCSYTLYVTHLPVLVFLRAWWLPGQGWAPTPLTLLYAVGVAALCLAVAGALAHVTEAHTDLVRGWLRASIDRGEGHLVAAAIRGPGSRA